MNEGEVVGLEDKVGKEIMIHLKGFQRINGTLLDFDDYMNLLLRDAEVYDDDEVVSEREIMVVKGGNVQTITC